MNIRKFLIMALFLVAVPLMAQQTGTQKIVILHTNDLHSHITGCPPESDYSPLTLNNDNTYGGFARIAGIFGEERGDSSAVVLTVDAGDFLMGTLFQGVELVSGFQLRLMKKMGYDVVGIGNHEFDYGPAKLAEIIGVASTNGDIPDLVLGNAVFDGEDSGDDALESLFLKGTINQKTVIERGGLKIGFFGIMGEVADENAAFAPPITFFKQVKAAKSIAKQLRGEGCDIVVCLSHSGVVIDKKGRVRGEDYRLAKRVKDIDVVIGGHTHTAMEQPLIVNGVPVVQTGEYGKNVGRLELLYTNGKLEVNGYKLIPVNDKVMGDSLVHAEIEAHKKQVTNELLLPLGMEYDKNIVEAGFPLVCGIHAANEGSNLGEMVADAIWNYVNSVDTGGTDISVVAVGVIRDNIVPGFQAPSDIFRLTSMGIGGDNLPGYPISKIYVTGRELKNVMEALLFSSSSVPENFCFYSGVEAVIEKNKMPFRKVSKIRVVNGDGNIKEVDFSKKNKELYSVSANAYLLASIGIIKEATFGLVKVEPKDMNGNLITDMSAARIDIDHLKPGIQEGKEWIAIIEYLTSMPDTNGNGIPDIDPKYRME